MKRKAADIIVSPLVTEKSTDLKDKERLLCFKVHRDANKIEIKKAVEELFKTRVEYVRVLNYKGKMKRFGRFRPFSSSGRQKERKPPPPAGNPAR